MLAHPLLALFAFLTITSFLPSTTAIPTNQELITLCPLADTGKFKCYSPSQYVLCVGAGTVVQPMAAGVPCVDGTGKQPPASAPAPTPTPAPSPTQTHPLTSTTSPVQNTIKPVSSPSPFVATYDAVHHGTKQAKTYDCSKFVHVIGVKVDGLFRCVDQTHYTICLKNYPSDIYALDAGYKCGELASQDDGILVA